MQLKHLLTFIAIALTATTAAYADHNNTISGTFFGTLTQGYLDLNNDGANGRGGHLHAAVQAPVEGCALPFTITPSGTVVFSTFLNSGAIFVEIDSGQTLCPDGSVEAFTGTIFGGTGKHEGATGTASFTLADDRVLLVHPSGSPTMLYVNDGRFTLNID